MVENWNFLISKSSGEYFLLLSDDDILDAKILNKIINGFEKYKNKNVSIAFLFS
jgi:hypothetical protein